MPETTAPWDAAEHLGSEEAILAYVDAALADGDPALVACVLGDIARARAMNGIGEAKKPLGRPS